MSRPMTWKELYVEADAHRQDAIENDRGMTASETIAFMEELKKAIREGELLNEKQIL